MKNTVFLVASVYIVIKAITRMVIMVIPEPSFDLGFRCSCNKT